ncbi:hypothetical protein LENED_005186 [Lentinula edodes]|uniref:Uncharacterized protein n=1 Tax=Lentinula edodes TaxID=5353 RepID=A0A1Q3E8A8_LENED|nr:hypothetical protein LENED_005186 [Lentinula edodes]
MIGKKTKGRKKVGKMKMALRPWSEIQMETGRRSRIDLDVSAPIGSQVDVQEDGEEGLATSRKYIDPTQRTCNCIMVEPCATLSLLSLR